MSEQVFEHFATQTKKKPMPMSNSQNETIKPCRFKWYLGYPMKYRKHMKLPADETQARDFGKSFHKWSELGWKDVHIIDGEVDFYGRLDTKDNPIPEEYIKGLYWLEDWAQKIFKERGIAGVTPMKLEWEIETKPYQVPFFKSWLERKVRKKTTTKWTKDDVYFKEHFTYKKENAISWTSPTTGEVYDSVWVKRMGFVDIVLRDGDGGIEIWDIKTGKHSDWSWQKGLRQQYYYKGILEDMGFKVSSIGLIYPFHKIIHQRVDRKVPKGTKTEKFDISKMSSVSIASVENAVAKGICMLTQEPIKANYDPYYCLDLCDFASPGNTLCNFEEEQDLTNFPPVANHEELKALIKRLSVEGITL